MRDPQPSPIPDSTLRDHLVAKGFDPTKIRVVIDNTAPPQPKTPDEIKRENEKLLIEEMKEIIHPEQPNTEAPKAPEPSSQKKEDWAEVDLKLEGSVKELRGLERSGAGKDDPRIQELRKEIEELKDEKFPSPAGKVAVPQEDTLEAARDRRKQINTLKLDAAKDNLNQLKQKGVGDTDPRIQELRAEIAELENKTIRGGKGGVADPAILGPAIKEALTGETPENPHKEELLSEKTKLLTRLGELRAVEREEGISSERLSLIQNETRDAQKKLIEFGQQYPDLVDPLVDNATLQRIISEHAQEKLSAKNTGDALQKSLENGDIEFVADTDALGKIDELEKQNDETAKAPAQTVAKQLPQSSHAQAMDDRWAEIEATRKAAGQSTGEDLTLEPFVPKPAQLEDVPVPAGEAGPHLIQSTEKIRPILSAEEIDFVAAKNAETRARIMEKLNRMTGVTKAIEERAEKVGATEHIRNVGEWWNKVPKRYKYMAAGAMFATGGGAWALGYTVASRLLGGAGLFVTFDTLLKGEYEKKTGGARSEATQKRHAMFAGVGALVVAGLFGKAAGNIIDLFGAEAIHAGQYAEGKIHTGVHLPNELVASQMSADQKGLDELAKAIQSGDAATISATEETLGISHDEALKIIQERGISHEDALKLIHERGLPGSSPVVHSITGEKLAELSTIKEGQGFWQPIHNQLAALHPDWTPEHLNHDTQTLLMKNGIINTDGSELQISKVGTHIVLNPDNTITYDHSAVYTAVPEPEVAEVAPHAPAPAMSATIPPEILPTNPAIVAAADDMVHNFADENFGTKGFLGFFAQPGTDSIAWKDLAGRPVVEIMNAHPSAFPEDGMQKFGIDSARDVKIAQDMAARVLKESGISSSPTEKFGEYIKRAAINTLGGRSAT